MSQYDDGGGRGGNAHNVPADEQMRFSHIRTAGDFREPATTFENWAPHHAAVYAPSSYHATPPSVIHARYSSTIQHSSNFPQYDNVNSSPYTHSPPAHPPLPSPSPYAYYGMPSSSSSSSPLGAASPIDQHPHAQPLATNNGVQNTGKTAAVAQKSVAGEEENREHIEAIHQHPLFPILRLLLEKVEEATVTANVPTAQVICAEVEALARRVQQTHATVVTSNPAVDDLMIQGVTVLRLHLFELEKVNELCRDFCQRYTSCLRRNLHTDQILRGDEFQNDEAEHHSHGSSRPATNSSTHSSSNSTPQPAPHNHYHRSNSGPPNYVAQPHIQHILPPTNTKSHQHGSPVLAAAAERRSASRLTSPISNGSVYAGESDQVLLDEEQEDNDDDDDDDNDGLSSRDGGSTNQMHDEDESLSPRASSKRGVLPKDAINLMKTWLFQHIVHPYPSEDEKKVLSNQTRLSMLQVNNWFINARRRILQPMLDSTAAPPSAASPVCSPRAKKCMQARPVDPFWQKSISARQLQMNVEPAVSSPPTDSVARRANDSTGSTIDKQDENRSLSSS